MNENKCKTMVSGRSYFSQRQCSRAIWKDGYCKQHHPDTIAERRKEADEKFNRKMKNSTAYRLHEALTKLKEQREVIERLEKQIEELNNGYDK